MNIQQGTKVKVFDIKKSKKKKNIISAKISSYEGINNGETQYCIWYASFVGKAFEKALELKDKDNILLLYSKIANNYDNKTDTLYVSVLIYDFFLLDKMDYEINEKNI